MTVKQRIILYLQNHPEGIDDHELARVLGLSARQQANMPCQELLKIASQKERSGYHFNHETQRQC